MEADNSLRSPASLLSPLPVPAESCQGHAPSDSSRGMRLLGSAHPGGTAWARWGVGYGQPRGLRRCAWGGHGLACLLVVSRWLRALDYAGLSLISSPLLGFLVADSCYQREVLTFYFECMSSGLLITSKCPPSKGYIVSVFSH